MLNGIESGLITRERYNNYLKMLKEAEYHEMSYVERRKKDKSFGKFVHSVLTPVVLPKGLSSLERKMVLFL